MDQAIHKLSLDNDLVQAPGWCRYAAEEMRKVAEEADKTAPKAKIEIIVYPEASADTEEVHYAVRVSSPEGDMVFNPNPAPWFPQYMGDYKLAPGFIPRMKATEKVL